MDVKHVLYRFAFTIYSAIGREFSENAVYSPYSAFISTVVSAIISPNDEIYSQFLQYIRLTENLSPAEITLKIQNIIQESETTTIESPYFLDLLLQISKKENTKDLAFNYMKKSEQYLMFSHIKKKIIEIFPEILFDSEDTLFLHFSDFYNTHKTDKRIKRFLKSIEIPISRLRKAPTITCPNIIFSNINSKEKNLQTKLSKICEDLRIDYKNSKFPQPAVDQINHLMDEHTSGLITQIISEESVGNDTKILNVNSIIFEAKWEKYFSTVESQDFHLYSGEKRKVKTMILRYKKSLYYENDNIQVLQLNYACSQYSMVYILNKNSQSVQISNSELESAIESLVETDVYMEIPRFETEFGPASIDGCFPPELSREANKNYMEIIQKVRIGNYEEGTAPTPPGERVHKTRKKKDKIEENKSEVESEVKKETEKNETYEDEKHENEANIDQSEQPTFMTENQDVESPEVASETIQNVSNIEYANQTTEPAIETPAPSPDTASNDTNQAPEPAVETAIASPDAASNDTNQAPEPATILETPINSTTDHLSIEIPTHSNSPLSSSSQPPDQQPSNHPTNRINTATSPTTSSTDIHLTSPPLNTTEEEEEDDSTTIEEDNDYDDDDYDDDFDCTRSGAKAEFICNHPFLFFVINRKNRVILFMGTITDPIAVDLQPLTVEERAEEFLASIRGDFTSSQKVGSELTKDNEVTNSKSIWDEIDQIGISPSQPSGSEATPLSPKLIDQIGSEKEDTQKVDDKFTLEAQMDKDLMDYVYEGKPKPKPDIKKINRMFGYESKKKKTFASFSPWSDVVFYKAKSALSTYKPLEKSKHPRGQHLPPLPPLSELSTTNWDELEKELEEYGKAAIHSSSAKKSTPKLIEPKPNAVLSLRGGRPKKY